MKKLVIGWSIITFLGIVDFILVRSLILESNATEMAALLGAILFVAGLTGGPAMLGIGLVEVFDETRQMSGSGLFKPKLLIILGLAASIISITTYLYIRNNALTSHGGLGSGYEGMYGDIILVVVPVLTTIIAFGVSLWMSRDGIDEKRKELENAKIEYATAQEAAKKTKIEYLNAVSKIWNRHFPGEKMPSDDLEAINKIRAKISIATTAHLIRLLPQIMNLNSLITPFVNAFKQQYRGFVLDPGFLDRVSYWEFSPDSQIGHELQVLSENIFNDAKSLVSNDKQYTPIYLISEK